MEYILLGLVAQGHSYGYELFKQLSSPDGLNAVWRVGQSQLYALLDKLEEYGLLASSLQPGEGHLLRKQYQLTAIGRETFQAWMTSPVDHAREMRQEFLARLYFARQAGSDVVLDLIDAQVEVCQAWLVEIQASLEIAGSASSFTRIVAEFRHAQVESILAWLESCRRNL